MGDDGRQHDRRDGLEGPDHPQAPPVPPAPAAAPPPAPASPGAPRRDLAPLLVLGALVGLIVLVGVLGVRAWPLVDWEFDREIGGGGMAAPDEPGGPGDAAAAADPGWRVSVDVEIVAGPEIVDDLVVVRGGDGSVHALDLDSGEHAWQVDVAPGALSGEYLVAGNGLVLVLARDDVAEELVVLDAATGSQVASVANVWEAPVVDDTGMFVADGGLVAALDRDGERRWVTDWDPFATAREPRGLALADGLLVVALWNGGVLVLDVDDGAERWAALEPGEDPLDEDADEPGSALFGDDVAIFEVAAGDDLVLETVAEYDADDDADTTVVRVRDLDDGTVRWSVEVDAYALDAGIVDDAGLVVVLLQDAVVGLDADDGDERWRRQQTAGGLDWLLVDGEHVYEGTRPVRVRRAHDGAVVAEVSTGDAFLMDGPALTPDGTGLVFADDRQVVYLPVADGDER